MYGLHPLVKQYFELIRPNLPHGSQLKMHHDINLYEEITIWHSHGSFTVTKSEMKTKVRESKISQIFKGDNDENNN